jgi:hypothetical protein
MIASLRTVAPVVGMATVAILLPGETRPDEPLTGAVPFSGPIVRILQSKCVPCHAPGHLAVPLGTYPEVRPWARAIREEILERRMPPWPAALSTRPFANELALTVRETALLVGWIDGGTPRGDDKDLPAWRPAPAALGTRAALEVPLPDVHVPPRERLAVRTVRVRIALPATRWVTGFEYRPGDRRLVRSVFAYRLDSNGARVGWLGGWTPWYATAHFPPATGQRLEPGSTLEIELHVQGVDEPAVERGTLGLAVAESPPPRELRDLVLVPACTTPAAAPCAEWRGARSTGSDALVWALTVDSGAALPPIEVVARRPDGSVEALLWIERPSAGWATPFVFQEPVALPRGTTVEVVSRAAADESAPARAAAPRVILSVLADGQPARTP